MVRLCDINWMREGLLELKRGRTELFNSHALAKGLFTLRTGLKTECHDTVMKSMAGDQ